MVAYNEQKPKTVSPIELGFGQAENGTPRPEVNITQSNAGSTGTIVVVIAAIVLIVGAYFLYTTNWSDSTVVPSVTQNNITVPAPAASTATPPAAATTKSDPATPPAAETTPAVKTDGTKPAQ